MPDIKYIYALCRSYSSGVHDDEREIVVGIEKSAFLTNTIDLFKTKRGQYVARLEEISRSRGCVIGKIRDSFNEWKTIRTVPIDDLVNPSDIYSPVK